jgi:hypothetical protein
MRSKVEVIYYIYIYIYYIYKLLSVPFWVGLEVDVCKDNSYVETVPDYLNSGTKYSHFEVDIGNTVPSVCFLGADSSKWISIKYLGLLIFLPKQRPCNCVGFLTRFFGKKSVLLRLGNVESYLLTFKPCNEYTLFPPSLIEKAKSKKIFVRHLVHIFVSYSSNDGCYNHEFI